MEIAFLLFFRVLEGGRFGNTAWMTAPNEFGIERRNCTGIGWVKLADLRQQTHRTVDGTFGAWTSTPEVQCIGRRFQNGNERGDGWSQVDSHTWAVVCGGTLRVMQRPTAGAEPDTSQPLLWQCEGVSFRIERVPVQNVPAQKQEAPVREPQPEVHNETDVEDVNLEDVVTGAARGVAAVASRAKTIVTFWASERSSQGLSPGSFAMDVAKASRRICAQAGKISRRSVEQARQVVLFPFRLVAAPGAPKPGQDPS